MTPRQLVTELLEAGLPEGIVVLPYARDGVVPASTTVMIRVDSVTRAPEAPIAHRRYTYAVIVVAAQVDDHGAADDELDGALEDVLHVIETSPGLPMWTSAERAVYGESTQLPAYEITLTVTHSKEQ